MGTKSKHLEVKRIAILLIALLVLLPYLSFFRIQHASAATQLNKAYVRLDSLIATATGVTGRVCFVAQVTTAIKSIQVTFPTTNGATDYTLNTTNTNWSLNTTNLNTGSPLNENAITGLPANATSISGKNLNIDISAGFTPANTSTVYCFNWSGASTLQVPSAASTETSSGVLTTYSAIAESGVINQSSYAEPQTVASTGDTVSVTATVPPSFSLSLSGTSDVFGNLAIASVNATSGVTATLSTNASSGWIVYVKDNAGGTCGKGGLFSSTKSYCIKSAAAINTNEQAVTGAEHYITGVTSQNVGTSGTCSAVAYQNASGYSYDGITSTPNFGGVLDNSNYRPMASCNGTSTSSTVTFKEFATITGSTPAATDYADTIFVTGAGEF